MSTGYECEIRELKPGAWYYILQLGSCPVGAWDWTEYANVIGPYPSAAAAVKGLMANEANPGGWSELPHCPGTKGAERDAELLKRAQRPQSRRGGW